MSDRKYIRALTIAGSDSGGGAGIQADQKTFSALGCYGMSVITALTAQNTVTVDAIIELDPAFVGQQIDSVISDIGVDVVKIGMLSDPEIIKIVAEKLKEYKVEKIVLDPVMVAKSGDKLLKDESISTLKSDLIPITEIITPNIPEAEVLSGMKIKNNEEIKKAAMLLCDLGSKSVLVKGGHHLGKNSTDILAIRKDKSEPKFYEFTSERVDSPNTHGTGCTISSSIAAFRAKGNSIEDSVKFAKEYITKAIIEGKDYKIGRGHGPVHHFHKFWE